jgi:proteasome lid subunit RPN8/RPN11
MRIRRDVIEHILAHAEIDAPVEACGYLLGKERAIEWAVAITNMEDREDHFTFEPQEQYDAHRKAEKLGMGIVGAYHSHPRTRAYPSAEDVRLAFDPRLLYVIASLTGGEKTVKAFWIEGGEVREEPLLIED